MIPSAALGLMVAALALDAGTTIANLQAGGTELNPLAQPFLPIPGWPAWTLALAAGCAYLVTVYLPRTGTALAVLVAASHLGATAYNWTESGEVW